MLLVPHSSCYEPFALGAFEAFGFDGCGLGLALALESELG